MFYVSNCYRYQRDVWWLQAWGDLASIMMDKMQRDNFSVNVQYKWEKGNGCRRDHLIFCTPNHLFRTKYCFASVRVESWRNPLKLGRIIISVLWGVKDFSLAIKELLCLKTVVFQPFSICGPLNIFEWRCGLLWKFQLEVQTPLTCNHGYSQTFDWSYSSFVDPLDSLWNPRLKTTALKRWMKAEP